MPPGALRAGGRRRASQAYIETASGWSSRPSDQTQSLLGQARVAARRSVLERSLPFYIAIQARRPPGAELIAVDHIGSAARIEPSSPDAGQSEFA
jgi:hypothetical protein